MSNQFTPSESELQHAAECILLEAFCQMTEHDQKLLLTGLSALGKMKPGSLQKFGDAIRRAGMITPSKTLRPVKAVGK